MIFLELVPRNVDELVTNSKNYISTYPELSGINVPDVPRLSIRSYEAAYALLQEGIDAIPHIRCMDFTAEELNTTIHKLTSAGLTKVLLITGDDKPHLTTPSEYLTPLNACDLLSKNFPKLSLFCGVDPYRNSFQTELRYCEEKIVSGATGFFTQALFDMHISEIYCQQLRHSQLFLGLSPVLTENSASYWKKRNRAIFPPDFELNLEYNCNLAIQMIQLAKKHNQHLYLMPIKVSPKDYLEGIFQPK